MHRPWPLGLNSGVDPKSLVQSFVFPARITGLVGLRWSELFWTLVVRTGLKVVTIDRISLRLLGLITRFLALGN